MAPPKPLGEFLKPCLGKALAAQGFAAADVLVAWPEIVGERLAPVSQPIKIEWPRGPRGGPLPRDVLAGPEDRQGRQAGTMVVRVEGAFAIELQHLAPLVLERINARYGWRVVGRLALRQGPVRRRTPPPRAEGVLSAADQQRIAAATSGVADENLRAALERLGRSLLQERRRPANGG